MLEQAQGHYQEAERLHQRALDARKKSLGPDHPDTLNSVNNLAMLYRNQGRYDEAEQLYVHALEARERLLGSENPDTYVSMNNLAYLYRSQGRFDEAEPLFRRSIEGLERVLGPEHPTTITSRDGLAALLAGRQDKNTLAEARVSVSSGPTADGSTTVESIVDTAGDFSGESRVEGIEVECSDNTSIVSGVTAGGSINGPVTASNIRITGTKGGCK
jgi:tetratricopeptide (TPR) repeat protein